MNKSKHNLKDYEKMSFCAITWLANHLGVIPSGSKLPSPLVKIHQKFFKILQSRGKAEAIKYIKYRRAKVYQLLSWSSDGVFSDFPGSLPKDLMFLRNNKERVSGTFIKLLLTVLSLSRYIRTNAECSFETITGSDTRKYPLPLSNRDCKLFWRSIGYSPKRRASYRLNFRSYHRTNKAGPNGHALSYCMSDLQGLFNDFPLLTAIANLGGPRLSHYLDMLSKYCENLDFLRFNRKELTRKLAFFADNEGKTREVAIFDYFSQTSLRPLHNYLFKALSKIRQDCTFDQTKYRELLEGSTEDFYSIDLTAFTDRFPVLLNHKLLKARIGAKRADSWLTIMTRPLESPIGILEYSVGNPMGAYSSWNSTALAHHAIVWKACRNVNVNWKTLPYALLGDDLVIRHRKVALEYCRLIRRLGVTWSKEKTHISPNFFEFAKRVHWNSEDVTPFPISALYEEQKRGPYGLLTVHHNAEGKGWFSPTDGVSGWMGYFEKMGLPRKFRKKQLDHLDKAWKVISVLKGNLSALEFLPFVEQVSPIVANIIKQRDNAEEILLNITLNSVMLLFSESLEAFYDDKVDSRPLGLVAEQITIFVTGIESQDPSLPIMDLPESIPHTHVWGVITEEFQKSQRRAYLLDTLHKGVWDATFRNILMPSSDQEIYSQRKPDILLTKTPKILSIFQSNITQLAQYPQLI